jgi:hypothetical protein
MYEKSKINKQNLTKKSDPKWKTQATVNWGDFENPFRKPEVYFSNRFQIFSMN